MRTDSTRISEVARNAAKKQIEEVYGKNYYENRYYKTKADSQDAHEGVRPTYVELTPDSIKSNLTNDQYKLYRLIYNRFIASQMANAVFDTMAVDIDAGEYNFKSNGQKLKFKGFMAVYVENEEEIDQSLPELEVGEEVKKEKLEPKQSFTEPPPRYTEASLVKTLEENGIGRPSTYSPTITTILERRYIEKEQKQLVPTELGRVVNNLLINSFEDIMNVDFTADIEKNFDDIAEGKEEWKEIIREFYKPFSVELEKAQKELEQVQLTEEVSDVPCDKCGRMMVVKYGRYGKFLACPGYPECKNTKPIIETIKEPCPKCGGKIQVRKSKKGRKFYICENNPDNGCDYISWNKPQKENEAKTKKAKSKK